jgi:hypothetical protein
MIPANLCSYQPAQEANLAKYYHQRIALLNDKHKTLINPQNKIYNTSKPHLISSFSSNIDRLSDFYSKTKPIAPQRHYFNSTAPISGSSLEPGNSLLFSSTAQKSLSPTNNEEFYEVSAGISAAAAPKLSVTLSFSPISSKFTAELQLKEHLRAIQQALQQNYQEQKEILEQQQSQLDSALRTFQNNFKASQNCQFSNEKLAAQEKESEKLAISELPVAVNVASTAPSATIIPKIELSSLSTSPVPRLSAPNNSNSFQHSQRGAGPFTKSRTPFVKGRAIEEEDLSLDLSQFSGSHLSEDSLGEDSLIESEDSPAVSPRIERIQRESSAVSTRNQGALSGNNAASSKIISPHRNFNKMSSIGPEVTGAEKTSNNSSRLKPGHATIAIKIPEKALVEGDSAKQKLPSTAGKVPAAAPANSHNSRPILSNNGSAGPITKPSALPIAAPRSQLAVVGKLKTEADSHYDPESDYEVNTSDLSISSLENSPRQHISSAKMPPNLTQQRTSPAIQQKPPSPGLGKLQTAAEISTPSTFPSANRPNSVGRAVSPPIPMDFPPTPRFSETRGNNAGNVSIEFDPMAELKKFSANNSITGNMGGSAGESKEKAKMEVMAAKDLAEEESSINLSVISDASVDEDLLLANL